MGRFHLNKLPKEKRIQMIAEFYDVIASLKNREEVRLFFKDLLTPDEIATLMRRIEVATLSLAGYTYDQIAKLLGVGRGKVTNVQKVLAKGGQGYKTVIQRLLEMRKRRLKIQKKRTKALLSDFERLKQKYPLYFLLFNLIDEISEALTEDKSLDKEALLSTPSRKNFPNSTTD
jgi:TrpR-related protein YerC/YecD